MANQTELETTRLPAVPVIDCEKAHFKCFLWVSLEFLQIGKVSSKLVDLTFVSPNEGTIIVVHATVGRTEFSDHHGHVVASFAFTTRAATDGRRLPAACTPPSASISSV